MRSISREDHDSEKESIIQSAKHENEKWGQNLKNKKQTIIPTKFKFSQRLSECITG